MSVPNFVHFISQFWGVGGGGVLKTLVLLKTKSKETEETTKAQSAWLEATKKHKVVQIRKLE